MGSGIDEFLFQLYIVKRPVTRRRSMSSMCGLHIPLGFISLGLLSGNMLLQRLRRKKVDRDDPTDLESKTLGQVRGSSA